MIQKKIKQKKYKYFNFFGHTYEIIHMCCYFRRSWIDLLKFNG